MRIPSGSGTTLGLILGVSVNGNVEASHVHHMDYFDAGNYVETHETCVQKKSLTHS